MLKQISFVLIIFVLLVGNSCTHQNATVPTCTSFPLPSLFISLPSNQLDSILKDGEVKVPADALLISAEKDTIYFGDLAHIKTRGNTTHWEIKKPFTIKFPKKQRLLGLDKSSSFVLLANALDESHIRNTIAFDLAHAIGLPAPKYAFLSLYINEEYKGLYQITNKVEVGRHTLNISDLDKYNKQVNSQPLNEYTWFGYGRNKQVIQRKGVLLENDPDDITGGYLLDNSGADWMYCKSISGFVSKAGDPIRIRSPKYASPNEVNYISNLYDEMESAVLSQDGCNPQTGKHYSEYIDIESFAKYYLLNELLMNQDGGYASFYMYKDKDSLDPKIYAGPVWDFDKSLSSPSCYQEVIVPNELYVSVPVGEIEGTHSGGLLYHLCQHDDFQKIVKSCYYKEVSPFCHDYLNNGKIDSLATRLWEEAERDNSLYNTRWNSDYYAATRKLVDFFQNRLEFFDWFFSSSNSDKILVCYQSKTTGSYERQIQIYYPIDSPIYAPNSLRPYIVKEIYNHDPIPSLYYYGTDSIIPNGTILHSPTKLQLRERNATWREVQMRRIKKKLGM